MRTLDQIKKELDEIQEFLLKGIPVDDIHVMLQHLSSLTSYLASTAALVAESGKHYNEAKVKAYHKLKTSAESNREYYAPSLAKDYVAAQCSAECYISQYAERINAATTHSNQSLITAISAEKQLLTNLKY